MAIFNSELLVYQRVPPMSMVHHYVAHSSMTIRRKPSPITLPLKSLHNLVDKTSKSKTISIFFTVPQLGLSYLQLGKLTSLTRQIQINEHDCLVSPRLHHFAVYIPVLLLTSQLLLHQIPICSLEITIFTA